MRISDWSSDVCSSDLPEIGERRELLAVAVDDDRAESAVMHGMPPSNGRYVCRDVMREYAHVSAQIPPGLSRHRAGQGARADRAGASRRAPGQALSGSPRRAERQGVVRSEEHTSELQSLMRISYAVF